MRERDQIERDLRKSRAIQRTIAWLGALGVVITVCLGIADVPGMLTFSAAAITVITTAGGVWITQSHIDDFEKQLGANNRLRTKVSRPRSSAA